MLRFSEESVCTRFALFASWNSNAGKDKNEFYKPTRTVVLRNLNLLKDLHDKPRAKSMVRAAWQAVVEELAPEMLKMSPDQKKMLQKVLKP